MKSVNSARWCWDTGDTRDVGEKGHRQPNCWYFTLQSLVSLKSFDSYFTRKKWPTRAIFWFYLFPSRALAHFFFAKMAAQRFWLPGKNGNSRAVLHTMWHALSNLQASRVDIGEFFCRNCWWLMGADGLWFYVWLETCDLLLVYDWFPWQCHLKCWFDAGRGSDPLEKLSICVCSVCFLSNWAQVKVLLPDIFP